MVDAILNEQGIENSTLDRNGTKVDLKLHKRIELYKKENEEVANLLMAIKWIGNEGSHELNGLDREKIIIAYEIIHHCLEKLYNTRLEELRKIANRINEQKGTKSI